MKIPNASRARLRRAAPAIAAVAVGTAGVGAALGSTGGDDSDSQSSGRVSRAAALAGPGDERDAFFADVANRLDVSAGELKQAIESASIDRIELANRDGRLTDGQAAAIERRIRSGALPAGPVPIPGPVLLPPPGGGPLAAAAGYLGMNQEELFRRLRHSSLAEVAEQRDLSADGLKQALLDDTRSHLDDAVESGRLDADERDRMLRQFSAHLDEMLNGGFPPPPRIRPGHPPARGGIALPLPPPGFGVLPRGGRR